MQPLGWTRLFVQPFCFMLFTVASRGAKEICVLSSFLDLVEAAACYPFIKKQWVEFLGERPDRLIDRVETTPSLGQAQRDRGCGAQQGTIAPFRRTCWGPSDRCRQMVSYCSMTARRAVLSAAMTRRSGKRRRLRVPSA